MSATDELRRLLDERGVEHYDGTNSTLWLKDEHGYRASADELTSGRLSVHIWCRTPEQAIAATLGNDGVERSRNGVAERGTCRMEYAVWDDGTCVWGCICSACGKRFEYETGEGWNYCSNCGAEVVE